MSAALDIRCRRGMEKLPRIRCDLRSARALSLLVPPLPLPQQAFVAHAHPLLAWSA
ncbi:hypothetical protein HaLaN_32533, partial [Haematococcus lacustris]